MSVTIQKKDTNTFTITGSNKEEIQIEYDRITGLIGFCSEADDTGCRIPIESTDDVKTFLLWAEEVKKHFEAEDKGR